MQIARKCTKPLPVIFPGAHGFPAGAPRNGADDATGLFVVSTATAFFRRAITHPRFLAKDYRGGDATFHPLFVLLLAESAALGSRNSPPLADYSPDLPEVSQYSPNDRDYVINYAIARHYLPGVRT